MSFQFLAWLAAFFLQAGLLGKGMYTMIALTDLEADNINPFDCSERVNRFALLEAGAQLALAALLLLGGKWLSGLLQAAVASLLVHMFLRGHIFMTPADAFKQLPAFKKRRFVIFAMHCFCFLLVTYRLIESGLHSLLTHEGRMTAKKLFREAATSLHY